MSQVRSKISSEWPRRPTKPDGDGKARHPLWDRDSDTWFCLHCDGKITGVQIAKNLWHCPACGAAPVDIFDAAFWCEDEGKSLQPIGDKAKSDTSKPEFHVVDDRPKLELNERNIVLLMRSALLDDSTNVSERLGRCWPKSPSMKTTTFGSRSKRICGRMIRPQLRRSTLQHSAVSKLSGRPCGRRYLFTDQLWVSRPQAPPNTCKCC